MNEITLISGVTWIMSHLDHIFSMLIALGVGVVTLIEYGVISPNLKVVYLNK